MREKWNKNEADQNDGQPIPQKFSVITDQVYKPKTPKLLLKSPSMRAIKNYNNLNLADTQNTYDNMTFIPENGDVYMYAEPYNTSTVNSHTYSEVEQKSDVFPGFDMYDYTTLGSSSVKTGTSNNGSELGSDKNDMGSTTKLVTGRMGFIPCNTCFTHLDTVLCTIALSANFGNLYRLPEMTLIRGGIPFMVAYVILSLFVGLPLLFLELGIGQMAQEGFIKCWRAVPFFKGVGYVKLIAGCLLSVYYPLYMAMSLFYVIWLAKGPLPFPECSVVKMKQTGYSASGIDGQQCLKKTFLESPFEDPSWFGIFCALLFFTWVTVTILSIRRTKSFIRSLSLLIFPIMGCLIALTVKAVFVENEFSVLATVTKNLDWSILKESWIWYHAAIQVFFSTHVGFGTFVTNAGIIYKGVNPLWTSLGFITLNLIFGVGSVVISYILSGNVNITAQQTDITELHLVSVVYSSALDAKDLNVARAWAIVIFATFLLSGLISMATITYTLLKAITVQHKRRLKWWQTSVCLSFAGLVSSCALLLVSDFQLVHLLDHYIVGNLILVTVIIEVFALIAFYGTERIKSDFEYMLGHILWKFWLILWWILPLFLTGVFAWALITLPHEDVYVESGMSLRVEDPLWIYGTGWGFVLTATVFIFVVGFSTIFNQDGYTFFDKFKCSVKPSHNWGPKDPIQRRDWIQWNTKAKQGERDFTLKRKGTRDYTRSIKREAKKAANSTLNRNVDQIRTPQRNYSYTNGNSHPEIRENPKPLGDAQDFNERPLRVTSLVDSLDRPGRFDNTNGRTSYNPLARVNQPDFQDGSNSDGYGTFRKGPYVIPSGVHVCHRRFSEHEDATDL